MRAIRKVPGCPPPNKEKKRQAISIDDPAYSSSLHPSPSRSIPLRALGENRTLARWGWAGEKITRIDATQKQGKGRIDAPSMRIMNDYLPGLRTMKRNRDRT
jgi:hypothetical protein